ncbi:MAG: hypothetical protein DHS20C17_33490 [Cyclobacteriaceae bacterium]|nr:MAG: hypothetical protein DHS20C17_33490 [Cyclobacteriaceae bacterium]
MVHIKEDQFYINGELTYLGRYWNGHKIEGLLFNSRMVQGIFDDENPETSERFKYPDTGEWDPERNTNEFVAAMESWRNHGLLAFTLNLQGGSPMGYGNQGWRNSAFDEKGKLKRPYMKRLQQILDKADELGMVVILGYFYFGQDEYFEDEAAVKRAATEATEWILRRGYMNVIVEVANECDNKAYQHDIIKAARIDELIRHIKGTHYYRRRLLVAASFNGNSLPTANVVRDSDFILIHGNGVNDPARITEMVEQTRQIDGYRTMPIVFNEDDHYDFDKENNNMNAAIAAYASWGFFDFRREGEGFNEGFQSVPVDWSISSDRKKGFFEKVEEITGH